MKIYAKKYGHTLAYFSEKLIALACKLCATDSWATKWGILENKPYAFVC